MHRKTPLTLLAAALFAWAGVASANGKQPQVDAAAGTFDAQHAAVLAELADGETYAEISAADRATVRAALDRMQARLAAAGSVDRLSADDRVATFNDQEVVNTILTKGAADSRLLCTRERPTGTRHAQTSCQTVAERRRQQEQQQQVLGNQQRAPRGQTGSR